MLARQIGAQNGAGRDAFAGGRRLSHLRLDVFSKRRVEAPQLAGSDRLRSHDRVLGHRSASPGVGAAAIAVDRRGDVAGVEQALVIEVDFHRPLREDDGVRERPPEARRARNRPGSTQNRRRCPVARMMLIAGHVRIRVLAEKRVADDPAGRRTIQTACQRAGAAPETLLRAMELLGRVWNREQHGHLVAVQLHARAQDGRLQKPVGAWRKSEHHAARRSGFVAHGRQAGGRECGLEARRDPRGPIALLGTLACLRQQRTHVVPGLDDECHGPRRLGGGVEPAGVAGRREPRGDVQIADCGFRRRTIGRLRREQVREPLRADLVERLHGRESSTRAGSRFRYCVNGHVETRPRAPTYQ